MVAQWCLIAWKVAIGRPNCSRIFAYPAAISVVSAATPAASAASTALATSVSRPGGAAVRLDGEYGPGHVGEQAARARQHGGGSRVEADPGRRPARVQVLRHL